MPTIPLISSCKTRNPSIMDADPAIMEAGRNARRLGNLSEEGSGKSSSSTTSSSKAMVDLQHSKANSTLINRMKISRPLKMKGLKTKAFFRTDRPSLTASLPNKTSTDEALKRDENATSATGVGAFQPFRRQNDLGDLDSDPATASSSKSDSSSTTLDDEDDSWCSSPSSSGLDSFRRCSWSSKTKAMFSTNLPKSNAVLAVRKSQTKSTTGSTSSFDAVSKLDSTSSSFMDVASNGSSSTGGCGEIMNFDMSMSSNASDGGGGGSSAETLDSEFGRVLQIDKRSGVITESPASDVKMAPKIVNVAALNAPRPESTRGSQRQAIAAASAQPGELADDVFEDSLDGGGTAAIGCGVGGAVGLDPAGARGASGVVSLGPAESHYAREIFAHFLKSQTEYQAMIAFPSSLGTLARGDTRAILISWIVQVHDYEGLENESLYLTVRITDIYCSVHDVILAEIQLVGIAAIFIASKQEERFPPEGKDLVRYTNNAYAIDDLYRMEVEILDRLKFKVNMPICWTFAAYLLSLQPPHPREVDWMTHYLLELSLLSKPMIVVLPSLVASAAVYMARFLFLDDETEDPWPSSLSVPATHGLVQLRPVVSELLAVLHATPNSKCNASFLKYSSESKFRGLSKLPILHNSYSLKRLAAACFGGGAGGGGLGAASNFGPPD